MSRFFERTFPANAGVLPIYWAGLSHFTLELCHNFMPVLYPLLTVQMGLSFTQIGLLALANNLVTSLFQPVLGFLPERYGAARVVAVSILWLGGLMGVVGFAPNFPLLALLVALASLGSAAYHPAGVVNVTQQNSVRRGTAMSIFSVGGSLGSALSPAWILLWVGALGTRSALMVIPVALVMSYLYYQQVQRPTPITTATPTISAASAQGGYLLGLILIMLGTMARAWFQVALITYLPAWVQSHDGSLAQGGQLLSILLFATGAGSLLGGIVADRAGVWGGGHVDQSGHRARLLALAGRNAPGANLLALCHRDGVGRQLLRRHPPSPRRLAPPHCTGFRPCHGVGMDAGRTGRLLHWLSGRSDLADNSHDRPGDSGGNCRAVCVVVSGGVEAAGVIQAVLG